MRRRSSVGFTSAVTEADPIRGRFETTIGGKPAVVEYEPDSDLRDTEQIPLAENGGIEAFLRREVLPYAPDAWYKPGSVKTGYEISFNRYFYKPEPMRTLGEIQTDIQALERESSGIFGDLFGAGEPQSDHDARPRIYVDTSVVVGCIDDEYREVSQALFERFRNGSAVLFHSELLRRELVRAPQAARDIFEQLPDEAKETIALTDEAVRLADAYIDEGAIGGANRAEARHVALASCAKVDVLASWNFRHMVSAPHLRAYNAVNRRMGHAEIRISSPDEFDRAGRSPKEF